MAKIQSTTSLIYDARKQASGIIRVEIADWRYEVSNNRYTAVVNDYMVETVTEENETFERLTPISSKNVVYPKSDIDALYFLLDNPIEITESYSHEMDILISMALLHVTRTDPIYGSLAEIGSLYNGFFIIHTCYVPISAFDSSQCHYCLM